MISKILQSPSLQPRISFFFSKSLEQFFLTLVQSNFGNKIPHIDTYFIWIYSFKTSRNERSENSWANLLCDYCIIIKRKKNALVPKAFLAKRWVCSLRPGGFNSLQLCYQVFRARRWDFNLTSLRNKNLDMKYCLR